MSGEAASPLRVLEVSSGIAGAYCGWMLKEMGAEVVQLVFLAETAEPADPIGLALTYYAAGKRRVSVDEAAGTIAESDLIITDDAARLASLTGRTIEEFAASHPHMSWV